MQLQLAELILLAMWTLAGITVSIGCITQHPKWYVTSLFGIDNRWGKLAFAMALIAFVVIRMTQWYTSANPTIHWGL